MPLKIELKPGERAILNGAVIEGASEGRTEFVVLNRASIMRQRHILQEEDANTPVKRLYFNLQMLYIEPQQRAFYQERFDRFLKDLEETFSLPAVRFALEQIGALARQEIYYEALKICRVMMETEHKLLNLDLSGNEPMPPFDIELE